MGNNKPDRPDLLPLLDEVAGPLSNHVVDAFLAGAHVAQAGRTERIRSIFVRRLLEELHPMPVRTVEKIWSFGRWIEAIRKSVGLNRADVATAVATDAAFIERLERSDVLPWTLGTATIADIVCLFRLHITAVEQLFTTSQIIFSRQHSVNAVARSSALDHVTRGESARRALDLYLAASSKSTSSTPLLGNAMESLRQELERRGARELLGAKE